MHGRLTSSDEGAAGSETLDGLDRSPEEVAALSVASPARRGRPARIREATERRWDETLSSIYDEGFGEISPTHREPLGRRLDLLHPESLILDAPCATGKYWGRFHRWLQRPGEIQRTGR